MLNVLLSTVVLGALAPAAQVSESKIVMAAMFKNGYAMILREAELDDSGQVTLADLPPSSLGTFWVGLGGGKQIASVTATSIKESQTASLATMAEALRAAVGKRVSLQLDDKSTLEGTLRSSTDQATSIESGGQIVFVPTGQIIRLTGADLPVSRHVDLSKPVLVVKATTPGKAKVALMSLVRGMAWSPSYVVELTTRDELTLTARTTVINDLDVLSNAEVRLVTGFPNIQYLNVQDPLRSGYTLDQFLGAIARGETAAAPGAAVLMNQAVRRDLMSGAADDWGEPVQATAAEDLFLFTLKNVSLQKGDRAFYQLFRGTAKYDRLYTADLDEGFTGRIGVGGNPMPPDVWFNIRFKNPFEQPLTTAPAATYLGDTLLGQSTLNYTSIGGRADVRVSKALDIAVESTEQEVSRQRGALVLPNRATYDQVRLEGVIEVRNQKAEAVRVRIRKPFQGELVSQSHEGPGTAATVTREVQGLLSVNTRTVLTWEYEIPAGGTSKLRYDYTMYTN